MGSKTKPSCSGRTRTVFEVRWGCCSRPVGYAKGNGVFVPSKGKVSLIVDTNGDDKADEEIIVATGWKEIAQNVDAVGIAMDKDGNIYFGLGTVNYANAYLVNENGVGEYDINSDRGTVQKVSADFSKRETVCTGIRFPIAFRVQCTRRSVLLRTGRRHVVAERESTG
jgi:glucose/arabinose dehydrogenase